MASVLSRQRPVKLSAPRFTSPAVAAAASVAASRSNTRADDPATTSGCSSRNRVKGTIPDLAIVRLFAAASELDEKLELELIQPHMAQKPVLRGE